MEERRKKMMNEYRFLEVQKIHVTIVWIVLAVIVLIMWYAGISQLFFNRPVGTRTASNGIMALFWIVFGILLPIFVFTSDIKISMDDKKIDLISTNKLLFHETIYYEDIDSYQTVQIKPIIQFGGWGSRGSSDDKLFSVGGKDGIELTMDDGTKITLTIKDPESMLEILDTVV